jgi:hypothetical protein
MHVPKIVSATGKCGQWQNNLHLIQFRKLEFQFFSSILGILQHALKLFSPVVVLNSFFKFSSLPLVTVGFGLQIVQSTVRELQLTLLEHVSFPNEYVQGGHQTYLSSTSILEHLFLFEQVTDTCRTLHEISFQAFQVHLKARGFLYLVL